MLLQLQFMANDIIGLLSQSITSLLKLISMIIHWNHHENTLSWWVFTSQCSSRGETHSTVKESLLSQISPMPVLCAVQVNNALLFLYNFERHGVPSRKQQLDFILIHNSQEVGMQIKVSMQTMLWEQGIELLQLWDPISAHPFYSTHFFYVLYRTF